MLKSGQTWAGIFVTRDADGSLKAPSSGPTGTLYIDGSSNSATVTITGSNPYKFSVTLPSLTAGQHVDMYITATISSIATAGIVASAQADTVLLSDGVMLADDAITAAKFDESTAFPLKAADTGSTQVARTGADADTLETLSDEIATVQADLDNPDQYKADVSGIPAAVWGYATRTLSSFGTLISDIWSHATRTLSAFGFTVATQSDANVTAIKAKTDNLPAIPAPANEYDAELAAIQADLDNPNQYKADVSNLATTAHVQEVEDKVDAIKLKTDNIPANPAIAGEYTASLAAIQADVSGIPDAILTKAIVDTLTVEQVLKVLAAVETGITTGGGTDTIVYTGKDGTVIRLTGVDEDGNRSAVIVIPGA